MGADHPYMVGVKYATLTDKKLEASIFYPIDKTTEVEWSNRKKLNKKALWTEDELRTYRTYGKALKEAMLGFEPPECIVRFYATRKLPALENADIARRFHLEGDKIRPMIFSHGLSASKVFYSALYHKMAANGYLVIALNHQDGTCFFTIDQNGKDLCYQKDVFEKKELREKQIKIRAEEVIKVIEELRGQENGTSTELFGKEVRLDMD